MRGEEYLTKPEQYALVYSKGSSWASSLLVMKALPNGLALSRCGLSQDGMLYLLLVQRRLLPIMLILRNRLRACYLERNY